MRRPVTIRLLGLIALVALSAMAFVVVDRARASDRARLTVVQNLPDDVRAELDVTWARFIEAFDGRRSCFDDVTLTLVAKVEGGDARYLAADARIEIEIPTTPERFRESVVHELAHHVESTCAEFDELRAVLHRRFGGPDRTWAGGDVWEETPSELWAEAVVQLVNGERILHADDMPIDPETVALVAAWANDG